jgi:hypothetical protein
MQSVQVWGNGWHVAALACVEIQLLNNLSTDHLAFPKSPFNAVNCRSSFSEIGYMHSQTASWAIFGDCSRAYMPRPWRNLVLSRQFRSQLQTLYSHPRNSSSSTRWKSRQGRDSYAREAKVQGLKSRAAFKLLEVSGLLLWVQVSADVAD